MRTRTAQFALIMGVVAWVCGLGFERIHAVTSIHAWCELHQEIVEVHSSSEGALFAYPEVGAEDRQSHTDHGCLLQGLVLSSNLAFVVVIPNSYFRPVLRRVVDPTPEGAPRALPLDYAPKTSPPITTC
ncbi:MAG: hypothetical protein JRJ84_17240 [Deltaproteobacteria bacterium]|nr:hypothetical protein [Deltaproteobacteria bacterium]